MRITSKGQVTIPADIRAKAGLLPDTDVTFEMDGKVVRLRRTDGGGKDQRVERIIARLRGSGDGKLTTDDIMAMTRGED